MTPEQDEQARTAINAVKSLRDDGSPGMRMFWADPEVLLAVLTRAACPAVCVGRLQESGPNWHQLCIEKAEKALAALEIEDL